MVRSVALLFMVAGWETADRLSFNLSFTGASEIQKEKKERKVRSGEPVNQL